MKISAVTNNNLYTFFGKKEIDAKTKATSVAQQEDASCLNASLSALASSSIAQVRMSEKAPTLPKSLYHLTCKRNFDRIMDSGKLQISSWEKVQEGLPGVYMLDRDNFLNTWFDKKYPSIFPKKEKEQPSMGESLIRWTRKDDDVVAIEIPTSKLDLSKLRIRPYLQAYAQVMDTINVETGECNDQLFREGLPLDNLVDYNDSDEPLEFVYIDEIPSSLFGQCKQVSYSDSEAKIVSDIFKT